MPHLTFSVITEAHLRLAKANGVFALRDAIELLELCLVDTLMRLLALPREVVKKGVGKRLFVLDLTYLARKVEFNGLDTNILRAGCHVCNFVNMCGGRLSEYARVWYAKESTSVMGTSVQLTLFRRPYADCKKSMYLLSRVQ